MRKGGRTEGGREEEKGKYWRGVERMEERKERDEREGEGGRAGEGG